MGQRIGRLWIIVVFAVLTIAVKDAQACLNATMSQREAVATLKEAEEALAIGDVATAHRLARSVADQADVELAQRGTRIDALATIRDPNATPAEITGARTRLQNIVLFGPDRHGTMDPTLQADVGEAFEAEGDDEHAYEMLAPLAKRDLIGSAFANAALSRVAKRRGETELAKQTHERCMLAATTKAICEGAYPRPARLWIMLDGKVAGYLAPAIVLLGALGLGRILAKRTERKLGVVFTTARERARRSPRTIATALLVLFGGTLAFLTASVPVVATFVAIAAGAVAIGRALDVRSFVREVALGRVEGFTARATTTEDAKLPEAKLYFLREPFTVEKVEDPSYREGARSALVRLTARPTTTLVVAGALATIAILLGMASFTTRALSKSATMPPRQSVPLSLDPSSR